MKNKKKRFHSRNSSKKLPLAEGTLSCSVRGGFGFVAVEGEKNDIYVDADRMGGANHGDTVVAVSYTHLPPAALSIVRRRAPNVRHDDVFFSLDVYKRQPQEGYASSSARRQRVEP